MAFAEFDERDFDQSAQAEQDKKLLVRFYYKSVQDKTASKREGRPIFKEKTYIDIKIPGSRDGAARPATPDDIKRFQKHHDAFKARVELPTEGTPLAEWPMITSSLAEEMSFMNIKTVEQLAALNDTHAGRFMGAHTYKEKARKWLERAKNDLNAESLQAQLAERDEKMAAMQGQLDEMKELVARAPKRRKSRAKPNAMPPNPDDPLPEVPYSPDPVTED